MVWNNPLKISQNTPDLLVLRFTRWKASLILTLLTLGSLWIGLRIIYLPDGTIGWLLLWLFLTTLWTTLFAEKSRLMLNATTGANELTRPPRRTKRSATPESFVFPVLSNGRIAPRQRVAPTGALFVGHMPTGALLL